MCVGKQHWLKKQQDKKHVGIDRYFFSLPCLGRVKWGGGGETELLNCSFNVVWNSVTNKVVFFTYTCRKNTGTSQVWYHLELQQMNHQYLQCRTGSFWKVSVGGIQSLYSRHTPLKSSRLQVTSTHYPSATSSLCTSCTWTSLIYSGPAHHPSIPLSTPAAF